MSCQNDEACSALLAPDPELISKLQELFRIGLANPISIRALYPDKKRKQHARNVAITTDQHPELVERWTAAISVACKLNDEGLNVYIVMNPIKPDFFGGAVSAKDILCRRLLLVDIDRVNTNDQPASDDEVKGALETARRIEEWMRQHGGLPCSRVMSGNGIHLYFRLDDWPNDDPSHEACRNILKALASRFNSDAFKVDTAVSDAPRITKLPGFIARKGQESSERPFRKAMFL